MRYALLSVGLLAVFMGIITWINALYERAPNVLAVSQMVVLAGVLVASIGAATMDIVKAINQSNSRGAGSAISPGRARDE